MLIRTVISLLCAASSIVAGDYSYTNAPEVHLWKNGAPGSEALASKKEVIDGPHEGQDFTRIWSIHNPSLLVYLPPKEKATGAAMIIAPGGGHRFLSIDMEGTNVAEWLNGIGVAAFVLKYRLAREEGSPYKVEDAIADGQRAVRTVRARAAEWNVNPAKIGFLGFSAGGEVAAVVSTQFDAGRPDSPDPIDHQSSRPDYQVLIYPGVRADKIAVSKDTPPTFMLCADNDRGPSTAIPNLYLALKKAGVPAEIHIYASGGHGFGLRRNPKAKVIYSTWILRLQDWMADVGMSPSGEKR
ncbi:MAG TPA: alpha/beta hydrolase [Bryobacteraceae bacterium]|jgi:endo-1,4-beta-xylanase|nr:alpha/beta hydrolase [Bryobacteraceae bacterium]